MNDDELRALVREAVHRHLGATAPVRVAAGHPIEGVPTTPPNTGTLLTFCRYTVQRVSDDGMCLIEPAVRCNHCGYCECHGH